MTKTTIRGADIVMRTLERAGHTHDLHAVRQPHHVAVRRGDRYAASAGAHAARGGGGAHGRCLGTADRRAGHRDGHRRSGPCQRRGRADDGAGAGVAAGAAVGPHRDRRSSAAAVFRNCGRPRWRRRWRRRRGPRRRWRHSAPRWRRRSASRAPAGPGRCISACRRICSMRRSPPMRSRGRSLPRSPHRPSR